MRKRLVFLLLPAICAAWSALAQKPVLGLPVGHKDPIVHLVFSRDGRYLLSSDRGSLKFWDVPTGKLLRWNDQRGATGFAKLSPDATKAYFESGVSDPVYLCWDLDRDTLEYYDLETQDTDFYTPAQKLFLERRTTLGRGAFDASIYLFSPDGRRGVLVDWQSHFEYWDVAGDKLLGKGAAPASLFSEEAKAFLGYGFSDAFEPGIGFGEEGPLVILREGQNTLQVWDLMKKKVLQTIRDDNMVWGMAVLSPDGKSIIATDRKVFKHYDRASGRLLRTWNTDAVSFTPLPMRQVPDGLLAGMTGGIRRWDFAGGGIAEAWQGATGLDHQNKPFDLQIKAPAQLRVWNGADMETKLLPALGRVVQEEDQCDLKVSPDLKRAAVHKIGLDTLLVWDLENDRRSLLVAGARYRYITPDLKLGLKTVYDESINAFKNAELWSLQTGQKHLSLEHTLTKNSVDGWDAYVVSADGQYFLYCGVEYYTRIRTFVLHDLKTGRLLGQFRAEGSGGDPVMVFSSDNKRLLFGLRYAEAPVYLLELPSGKVLQQYHGQKGGTQSLAFSTDERYVYAAGTDQTLRIWETQTGVEKAALTAIGERDWVVTTPAGLFDASPGAMKGMYYILGREIIELEQLKERYYEPGLLGKLLGFNNDPLRSVEGFGALPLYPKMDAAIGPDQLSLAVTLTPRSGGIGKLSLFVNGKEVLEDANPQRAERVSIDLTQFAEYYLPGENNLLALRAYNAQGWLKSSALELGYQPPATARGTSSGPGPATLSRSKPALYAIVVGTADYAGEKLDLKYADLDAAYFSQALRAAAPGVYADKVAITLLNTRADDPERQGISSKAAIRQAFADLVTKAKAQDVLIVYFSGHGVTYGAAENAQFYYLTKDIASENLSDPEIRNNYAISSAELTEWIKAIPALKQVMVIDACNSGKIVEDLAVRKDLSSTQIRALDRMKDRTGMFILTGSAADMVSYEAGQYGQGLLTFSLLEGMSGPALSDGNVVDVMTLFQHARNRVPELARGIGGIQSPVLAFPDGGASFDIGLVGPGVKIPLAKAKPVFVRNNFLDDDIFDDRLGLSNALADYFRSITSKGAQADMLYWDNVNEYENAYSIKGLYTISGDVVTVRARLFKGKTMVGEKFSVTGKKSNVPALVEAIVGKVQGMVK